MLCVDGRDQFRVAETDGLGSELKKTVLPCSEEKDKSGRDEAASSGAFCMYVCVCVCVSCVS